jgi:hypothetical protein
MRDVEMLADLVTYAAQGTRHVVAGLSREELTWRPDAEGNSIGETVWHCSRWLDVLTVQLLEHRPAEAEQWHTRGWAEKTDYDPRGIGYGGFGAITGYTQAEVAAIPFLSADEHLTYLDQVCEPLCQRLLSLPEGALDQPIVAAGRKRSAYQWIRMLLMGFAGHVGEMEALKAMQTRAKQP